MCSQTCCEQGDGASSWVAVGSWTAAHQSVRGRVPKGMGRPQGWYQVVLMPGSHSPASWEPAPSSPPGAGTLVPSTYCACHLQGTCLAQSGC